MALTPDELRKRIPQWSLESDGQLLQYMVQISKNLEEKCNQTQNNLNRLLLEVDESHIRYANASNNFNGIQQLKFVENRVQDDDESFYSVREEEEEKGEKLPYGEIFYMALEQSVANMYKSFEKVTVQLATDSESDDDDDAETAARNTVLRAIQKYPYIDRPLPYIIGSREWREKWHAGLIDSDEESETETKEQYSDSSDSERMFPSQTNSNHTPSESEGSVWGLHADPRRRTPSIDPSMSGDDALSIHSSSSAMRAPGTRSFQNNHHTVPVPPGFKPPSLFPDQPPPDDTISVSSRRHVTNLFEESDDEESTPTHRPYIDAKTTNNLPNYFKGNRPDRKTINLFTDEPPPRFSNHGPSPAPSTSSHSQKKHINLFIDSDDDDSYNNNSSSKNDSVYQSEPPELPVPAKRTINLFDGEEEEEEVTPKANPTTFGKPVGNILNKINNNGIVIEDMEDDLFVPVQKSINGINDGKRGVRRITNLFDDEPPEDEFDKIFKENETGRKVTGGKLVLPPVQSGKQIIDKADKNTGNPQRLFEKPAQVVVQNDSKKPMNLFADDDNGNDDTEDSSDIFSPRVMGKKGMKVAKPKVNLFDDDEGEQENGASKLPQSELAASKDITNKLLMQETVKPKEGIIKDNPIRSEILKKKSIFDSDSDEGEDAEDFLFGRTPTAPSLERTQVSKNPPSKQKSGFNSTSDSTNSSVGIVFDEKLGNINKVSIMNENQDESKVNQAHNTVGSEILKNKAIFASESSDSSDNDFECDNDKSIEAHVQDLPPNEDNKKVVNDLPSNVTRDFKDEVTKALDKPKIPDEPPEDDVWEQPSSDSKIQAHPDVSNDIDYYLTTNRIHGTSEASSSTSLIQAKQNDRIENSLSNKHDTNEGNLEQSLKGENIQHSNVDNNFSTGGGIDFIASEPVEISTSLQEQNDEKTNDKSINKSALNFNSIGLFDDIPPPDDDFDDIRSSLTIDHTDDGGFFSLRVSESSGNTTGSSQTNHYLFMDGDGPPPDDEVDDAKTVSDVHVSAPFKSISAIIGQRNKNQSNYEDIREKPKVNRLSTKVNINVNALLPGARKPPTVPKLQKTTNEPTTPSIASYSDSNVKDTEDTNNGETKLQQEPDMGMGKLASLNKGRPKIQVKRKPPSRQNRRTNYEKYLVSERNDDLKSLLAESSSKEEIRIVVGSEQRVQHVETTAAQVKIDQMLSNELSAKLSEPKLFDESKQINVVDTPKNNSIVPKKSFPTAEEMEEQSILQKLNTSIKLFSDEDSDDNLFGKISKPNPDSFVIHAVGSVKSIEQKEILSNKATANSAVKKQSIFDDSDDGEDLFSKPRINGKAPMSKINYERKTSQTAKNTGKSKSIFGTDEDSDTDDIFGGAKSTTKPKMKLSDTKKPSVLTAAKAKSLFGDDDDEDDDLFGSKSKPKPKTTKTNPVLPAKTLSKLTSTGPSCAEDDPLADLLK